MNIQISCKWKAITNYQRYCHANVSNIFVRFGESVYPLLSLNASINNNQYSSFYKSLFKYIKV